MTNDQIKKAIDATRGALLTCTPGASPRRDPHALDVLGRVEHLLWMYDQIDAFLTEKRIEKAFRWLGFMQGACWAMAIRSIEDAKRDNAPEGAEFAPERV